TPRPRCGGSPPATSRSGTELSASSSDLWRASGPNASSHGPRDVPPLPALLNSEACVVPSGYRLQLALKLAVALEATGVKGAVRERRLDRAARLGPVCAVVEAAPPTELFDVVENGGESILSLPQLRLAHTWGVDDHPAAWQLDQLPVARHVPALAGRFVDLSGAHHCRADQAVDQGRLAHA